MKAKIAVFPLCAALGSLTFGCLQNDDGEFARQASRIGELEVELGNYAAANARSPAVQEFGRSMVEDHDKANQQLMALAGRVGVSLGDGLTSEQRAVARKLENLHGAEFDQAYVKAMVDGHEQAIKLFSAQAGQNRSEIDRWAADELPVLREHLAHAQMLEKSEQVSSNR